jgi:predicted GIY-YIG superfamily endonuclease
VYLIHFDEAYKHAQHYTGQTADLPARIEEHRAGRGARLMEVITEAGIDWRVVRTWPGGRNRERAIKNRHEAPRLCPECSTRPKPVTTGKSGTRPTPQPTAAPAAPHQRPPQPSPALEQAPVPKPPSVPDFQRGEALARVVVCRQIDAGFSPDKIVAVQQQMLRDYDPRTARSQTRELHRGYQSALTGMLGAYRQTYLETEPADAGIEVG